MPIEIEYGYALLAAKLNNECKSIGQKWKIHSHILTKPIVTFFAFCLFLLFFFCSARSLIYINKHLMTGPEGNSEFCFPRISMFPETKSRETLRFEGNKIHCSPRDQSLSDLLYSKANGSSRWKTNNRVIDKWRATAVNISRVTVNCFPFDVIVFAMLPAHGIWRETVWLLDVMW